MTTVFYAILFLACFVLVAAVLLQPGKADAGALFTSSVSSTAFGPRGTQTVLAKITIGAAVAFMFAALVLSQLGTGNRSVLQSTSGEAATEATPATAAASPELSPAAADGAATTTTSDANTAVVVDANSNTGANANNTGESNVDR